MFLRQSRTVDRGCQPAPGLPCALFHLRVRRPKQSSGAMSREDASPCQLFHNSLVPRTQELSPNFGDGLSRSGGGGYGLTVSRFSDDLDPVVECHTKNEFWQLVVAIETTPAFVRGLKQFEDHRERRPVGQATLRSDGAVAHGGEGAFNGIGRPQVFPVLGGEVVERQ